MLSHIGLKCNAPRPEKLVLVVAVDDVHRHGVLALLRRSVNVLPCLRGDEGELVGSDADDGAVGFVEGVDGERDVAAELLGHFAEVGAAVEERAGVACERVEVEVVDEGGEGDKNQLWVGVLSV